MPWSGKSPNDLWNSTLRSTLTGSNAQQDPQVGQKWSAILEMAPGYFSNLFLQIRGKDYGKAVYKVFSRIQRQMSTPPHSRKEAPLLLEFCFSPDSWKL